MTLQKVIQHLPFTLSSCCCSLTFLYPIAISLDHGSFPSINAILVTDMLFSSFRLLVLALIASTFLGFSVKTSLRFPNFTLVSCFTDDVGCLVISSRPDMSVCSFAMETMTPFCSRFPQGSPEAYVD